MSQGLPGSMNRILTPRLASRSTRMARHSLVYSPITVIILMALPFLSGCSPSPTPSFASPGKPSALRVPWPAVVRVLRDLQSSTGLPDALSLRIQDLLLPQHPDDLLRLVIPCRHPELFFLCPGNPNPNFTPGPVSGEQVTRLSLSEGGPQKMAAACGGHLCQSPLGKPYWILLHYRLRVLDYSPTARGRRGCRKARLNERES